MSPTFTGVRAALARALKVLALPKVLLAARRSLPTTKDTLKEHQQEAIAVQRVRVTHFEKLAVVVQDGTGAREGAARADRQLQVVIDGQLAIGEAAMGHHGGAQEHSAEGLTCGANRPFCSASQCLAVGSARTGTLRT